MAGSYISDDEAEWAQRGGLVSDGPDPHICELPPESALNPGAVALCLAGCGRFWVLDPIPWERTWRRVRPWPFDRRARRAIRAFCERQLPGPARKGNGAVPW